MATFPEQFREFVEVSVHNATRLALHVAEFLPIPEAVQVVVRGADDLIGARIFFEPPVKAVFWHPNGSGDIEAYGENRKKQAPLDCTYFIFPIDQSGKVQFDLVSAFENPATPAA